MILLAFIFVWIFFFKTSIMENLFLYAYTVAVAAANSDRTRAVCSINNVQSANVQRYLR